MLDPNWAMNSKFGTELKTLHILRLMGVRNLGREQPSGLAGIAVQKGQPRKLKELTCHTSKGVGWVPSPAPKLFSALRRCTARAGSVETRCFRVCCELIRRTELPNNNNNNNTGQRQTCFHSGPPMFISPSWVSLPQCDLCTMTRANTQWWTWTLCGMLDETVLVWAKCERGVIRFIDLHSEY